MSFAKRLDRIGPPLAISAVDARKVKPPYKTEICLQRVLMVDHRDGIGPTINGAVHCELAPLMVGGAEATRLMLGAADLMREWLEVGDAKRLGELAGEMRECMFRINALADSIAAAKEEAEAEHTAFHAAEEQTKGAPH